MTAENVLPVAVHGWTWTATLVAVLNVLVGGAFVTWLKNRPKMLELEQSADAKLIETLSVRVEKLEQKLEQERLRHDAEASLLRHRANNADQCIDALLMLLEDVEELPDRARRAVKAVRDMRTRQHESQALEKGAMTGAKLAAVQGEMPPSAK